MKHGIVADFYDVYTCKKTLNALKKVFMKGASWFHFLGMLLCSISWECATGTGLMESYGNLENVNRSG